MKTSLRKTLGVASLLSLSMIAASHAHAAVCSYTLNNEWNTGFQGTVSITNNGTTAINGWTVGWSYTNNRITGSWNANLSGNNPYSASALNWNSSIQPGQSVSFGVQGDKHGSTAEIPAITGSVCSGSTSSVSSTPSSSSSAPSSTPPSSSSSVVSISSSSALSSCAAAVSQCNWYGTLYPTCETTVSGWGYENGKSCISTATCASQPSPFGVVAGCGVASSSVTTSSSSVPSSSVAPSSSSSSSISISSSSVSSSAPSSVSSSSSSSVSSSSTASAVDLANCVEPTIPVGAGQAKSGYVVYEPVAAGSTVFDYNRPYVTSCDGTKYSLPYPHIFNYGTDKSIILDNFADNDHQNNMAAALATYRGENYTEGGGYWYTFADKNGTTMKNATGLAINAYNIGKAISNNELHIKMTVTNPGFAGVGTNILFEETGVDLMDLDYVQVTAYGSGTIGVMFETTDIDKPAEWGNYATKVPMTLTATPTVYTYNVADFEGELHSGLAGMPLAPHLGVASKFFFQAKDGAVVDIHVKKIEFFFKGSTLPLRLASFEWKTGELEPNPGFVFNHATIGVPALIDATDPYINFATATVAPTKPQTVTVTKTAAQLANTGKPNWLHVEGTKLFDTHGHLVRLTGVNWFGFETKNQIPFGLWARSYKSMLAQIKALGFNTVRIPYSDYMLDASRDGTLKLGDLNIDLALNGVTAAQSPLDLLDAIIAEARLLNLKVMLDSHSRMPDSYLSEGLWNPSYYPEEKWIANWVFIASRYATNDAVIAFDLKNEPHFTASWGSSNAALNWNEAAERCANAIQAVNPNALIVVEGVEGLNPESTALNKYWWGGNMQGVLTHPINITFNNKLVYSPHEYGPEVYLQPWFRDYRFPLNLRYIWEDRFGFIYNQDIGHTFVGEFGIKENVPGSASNKWFEEFAKYMDERSEGYSWTYWAWNPNSGDTGGILTDDWEGTNDWKLEYLESQMAPIIGNQNGL
jgi:aryl-phospho-beta-D-glucosidase BglC (GH1 family)